MEGHLAHIVSKQCLAKTLKLLGITLIFWFLVLLLGGFRISFLWEPAIPLRSATNMKVGQYVKFENVTLYESGTVRLTNGNETNRYLVFFANDEFVITMVPIDIADELVQKETVTIIGLVDTQRDYELEYDLIHKVTEYYPVFEPYFSEFILRYDTSVTFGWGTAWVCFLAGLIPFYWIIKNIRVMLDYKLHPVFRTCADHLELDFVEADLEAAYQSNTLQEVGDTIFLSKNYFLSLLPKKGTILKITDLLWVYMEEVQSSRFSWDNYLFLYFKDPIHNQSIKLKSNEYFNIDNLRPLYPFLHFGLNPDNIAWYEEQIKDVG